MLHRLEQEQREFKGFLERLHQTKEKAEFNWFMVEQRPGDEAPPPEFGRDESLWRMFESDTPKWPVMSVGPRSQNDIGYTHFIHIYGHNYNGNGHRKLYHCITMSNMAYKRLVGSPSKPRVNMEHFDIILSLAGLAFEADAPRAAQQVERLRDALAKSDSDQAAKLARLLSRSSKSQKLTPMAFEEMRATADAVRRRMPGEALSRSVPLPHDKETGAPLARILFPDDNKIDVPVLTPPLSDAICDLLTEWKRADELARIGTNPHTRCLIYGAPGVGKTKLAYYLARQLELPLVEARLDGLVSSFLGTTARNIGALFDFANRYRCALFLDEFDAIAKARDDSQEVGEIKRVVNSLLQSLDARNGRGITLAATNHEHLLDAAVWRRFEARIHIPKPDARARAEMLDWFVKPLRLSDIERQFLVWATEGMSGADLEALVIGGKRFFVLHGDTVSTANRPEAAAQSSERSRGRMILEALKRQASLNSRLFDEHRRPLLVGPDSDLAQALLSDGFTQRDVGDLIGVTQSAVSRLAKRKPRTSLRKKAQEEIDG